MTASFTESLMKPGTWEVDLLPDTPKEVTDVLRLGQRYWGTNYAGFGTVFVTPTRVPLEEVGLAGVMDAACYAGRLSNQKNRTGLSGDGLSVWLGDVDGKGALRTHTETAASFTTWITSATTITAHNPTFGTITDPGGTFTWDSDEDITNREALAAVGRAFSTEWRLNPDLTFDAGTSTALYGSTPVAIWYPNARQSEPGLVILRGTAEHHVSLDDHVFQVEVVDGTGASATSFRANEPVVSDPWYPASAGAGPQIMRRIPGFGTFANLSAQAAGWLAFEPFDRETIELTVEDYDPSLMLCGKSLYLYDPMKDIDDPTATPMWVAGEYIRPMTQRVVHIEWEFPRDGGFYFQNANGNLDQDDRPIYDFTRWVDKSGLDGTARITCGALQPQWEQVARNRYEEWSS